MSPRRRSADAPYPHAHDAHPHAHPCAVSIACDPPARARTRRAARFAAPQTRSAARRSRIREHPALGPRSRCEPVRDVPIGASSFSVSAGREEVSGERWNPRAIRTRSPGREARLPGQLGRLPTRWRVDQATAGAAQVLERPCNTFERPRRWMTPATPWEGWTATPAGASLARQAAKRGYLAPQSPASLPSFGQESSSRYV